MKFIKNKSSCLIVLLLNFSALAQPKIGIVADQIVAITGNKIVLQSEVEYQYAQYLSQGNYGNAEIKCRVLDQLVLTKMLLHHAIIDSVDVKDDQVDRDMDQRMASMLQQFGSKEKMEEYYNKTELEWRDELRPKIKDRLLWEAMRSKVLANITVSPADIKAYYESFNADSLPLMNAEIEYAQIVRNVRFSDDAKKECKETLEKLRQRVRNGEDFAALAVLYSQDKASAKLGGELGYFNRADLVPEFSAAAFKLKPGEVSQIVETKFGYHIIQLIDRKGDQMNCRHILIRPLQTEVDEEAAVFFLDSISDLVKNDSMSFAEAAEKFSDEADSRQQGGTIVNPQTGSARYEVDQIDATLFFQLDQLSPGEYTKPLPYVTPEGKNAFRIMLLKVRTKPHKLNLVDDYQYLQSAALDEKSQKTLETWVKRKLPSTYIYIDNEFKDCDVLKHWFIMP